MSVDQIREHMEVIGADGVHVGTVDRITGQSIKLTKADGPIGATQHRMIPLGLVAEVEGDQVRLSANGDVAILFEEPQRGLTDDELVDEEGRESFPASDPPAY